MISNRLYSFIKFEHNKAFVFKSAANSFALYELPYDAKSTFTVKKRCEMQQTAGSKICLYENIHNISGS